MTWPKGEGQKITDNVSSEECKYLTLTFNVQVVPSNSDDPTLLNQDMVTFDIYENPKDVDKLKKVVEPREGPDW